MHTAGAARQKQAPRPIGPTPPSQLTLQPTGERSPRSTPEPTPPSLRRQRPVKPQQQAAQSATPRVTQPVAHPAIQPVAPQTGQLGTLLRTPQTFVRDPPVEPCSPWMSPDTDPTEDNSRHNTPAATEQPATDGHLCEIIEDVESGEHLVPEDVLSASRTTSDREIGRARWGRALDAQLQPVRRIAPKTGGREPCNFLGFQTTATQIFVTAHTAVTFSLSP